jgi:hypothetical protein
MIAYNPWRLLARARECIVINCYHFNVMIQHTHIPVGTGLCPPSVAFLSTAVEVHVQGNNMPQDESPSRVKALLE